MKIAYLTTSTITSVSANSVHVMNMASAMARRDFGVNMLAVERGQEDVDPFQYYGVNNSFEIDFLNESAFLPNKIFFAIRKIFPFVKVGYIPSILFGVFCVRNHVIESRPSLIYSRNIPWLFSLRDSGVDYILETHRPPANVLERYVERSIIVSKRCKGVVVISNALKNIYREILDGTCEDKFIVAHDGANVRSVDEFDENAANKNDFVVGYVGHLYQGRGVDVIVDMARQLPNIKFVIVGGSDADIDNVKGKSDRLPNNINFLGHVPRSEVDNYLKTFSVVLAPYQQSVAVQGGGDTSAFMSPLKIFEYMASGVPIVASNLPVLREVLEDMQTALLVPPTDVQAWVSAVEKLLGDSSLRVSLAAAARQKLVDEYSWDKRCSRIFDKVDY